MFRLVNKIQIGNYGFTGCVSIEIIQSRDNYVQTAVIQMPNIFYKKTSQPVFIGNTYLLNQLIQTGDVVKIWNGYNKDFDNLTQKFQGFVVRMHIDDIITIYCEDYGYALKQVNIPSKVFTGATIKDIIEYVLQGLNIDVEYDDETTEIGDWVIDNNSNINALQVFDKLNEFGIRVYFQNKVLRIGGLTDTTGDINNFIFEHNIVENNLEFNNADAVNLVLKGVSNLEKPIGSGSGKVEKIERYAYLLNGKVQVKEDGIPGEQRTLNYYNLTATQLETNLRNNFNKYIYTGYNGNFKTFLEPFVSVNNFVNLYSLRFPERNSQYKVKSVMTEVNINGGFQTIELDYKITDLVKVGI